MAYSKTTWIARIGTFLNRFTKTNESGSSVDLTNDPTITTAGTPFSVGNMNKIEQGIFDAAAAADANTVKTNTLDGTGTLQGVADGDGPTFGGGVMTDNVVLKTKVIEIGDWDLGASAYHSVTHGLTQSKIRDVSAVIRTDDGVTYYGLVKSYSGTLNIFYITGTTATVVNLFAYVAISTNWDEIPYNRGWVTILYEA